MKNHLIISGIIVLFLTVGCSGCFDKLDLDKPDYITVNLEITCSVVAIYGPSNIYHESLPGLEVRIDMVKAGGERITSYRVTNDGGYIVGVKGSFNLYREQPIICTANLQSDPPEKYINYSWTSATRAYTWDYVYSSADFGESITLYPTLDIQGVPP